MGFALWSPRSQCRCACLLRDTDFYSDKCVTSWNSSGEKSLAEQSVASDEERTGGFDAAASVCVARLVGGRTNCNLHAAGHGLACCLARNGPLASHFNGFPTTRLDVG